MGTKLHKPASSKTEWLGHAHDDATRAAGPGERPGVPSRVEAARARLKAREK
jgi:hypothetical protein